jgi:predicted nucleic acid-binding protein
MQRGLRVFLDTSALLAGLNSPTGAAGTILTACFIGEITPIISPQVIEESERNISLKFPKLQLPFQSFLLIPPEVTSTPTLAQIRKAYKIIPTSDAPILAAALKVQPNAFVTWDIRDFLKKQVQKRTPFPILLPGEFLKQFLR